MLDRTPSIKIAHCQTMSAYGFNILRLISTRRARSPDATESSDSDESTLSESLSLPGMQKGSWFSKRRPKSTKRSLVPTNINRLQSQLHNVSSSRLAALRDETPRTSTSSLYSCDSSHQSAGQGRSTLCSIGSKEEGSQLSLQVSSATSVDGDDLHPVLKNNDRFSLFVDSRINSSESRLSVVEALFSDTENKETKSTRSSRVVEVTSEDIQETVKQLAHGVNQACEIASAASTKVNPMQTSFNETPKLPPADITRQPSKRVVNAQRKKRHRLSRTYAPLSPTNSIRRNPSLTKVTRQKSTKKRPMKAQQKSPGAKHAAKSNSKWTENVSDLLSGKLFQKIEADEMLTPAQIEAYTLRRLSKLQCQSLTEKEASIDLDTETVPETPLEPFHMDDLPSRIGSSGVKLTVGTPVEETPDPKSINEVSRTSSLGMSSDGNDGLFNSGTKSDGSSVLAATDSTSPNPQIHMKSPCRYMFRKIPELPTISEGTLQDNGPFVSHGLSEPYNYTADTDYVFFHSTPFTITALGYRHGPIRLAKADVYPDPKLGADDGGLDWTAFQMAILGGAGDYFSDSEHMIRRQEAEDADAICTWWDELNLDGCGSLVTRNNGTTRHSVGTGSGIRDKDYLYREIGCDNPYNARHKWRSLRRTAALEGRKLDLDLRMCHNGDMLYSGGSMKRRNANGHARKLLERASMASMPQSPMMDLCVITSDNGDVDYVPMGFNLSHDLGDFLSWETDNVYHGDTFCQGGVV